MVYKNIIKQRIIKLGDTLFFALKIMDKTGFRSLLVLDDNDFFAGILSIGDIQRAIIKNLPLETCVRDVIRPNPRIAHENMSLEQIKNEMTQFRMEFIPIIDKSRKIRNVYFWEDLFVEKEPPPRKKFKLPVVIMAGGVGTRLRPLTNVLPKPLIPIGEKTMLEEIFERFGKHGCKEFFISVNFKAGLIEYYIRNKNLPYQIDFLKEDTPLGTAGSLSLLKGKVHETFFVSNCDILIDQDYSEILDYHKGNKNEITIVAALKNYSIPYGTIKSGENGKLLDLKEKPELTFKINSGMYILEPHILNEIPDNTFLNITQLIEGVKLRAGKIGVFPVPEKSWKDIGSWKEYTRDMM
jgi:dTDP-glucose pyrophosphorylase